MPRPRKPITLHRLEGTYRNDRHAARVPEPVVPGELGAPPPWFNPTLLALWSEVLATVSAGHHRVL